MLVNSVKNKIMKLQKLEYMTKGWFVGNFAPAVYKTDGFEVAVKKYSKNGYEGSHYHKLATEITVVINGQVKMNGNEYKDGDIIVLEPHEKSDFMAVTDTTTVVVKIPGVLNDKYPVK